MVSTVNELPLTELKFPKKIQVLFLSSLDVRKKELEDAAKT